MANTLPRSIETKILPKDNGLPPIHRHITTHSKKGTAIFDGNIPSNAKWQHIGPNPEEAPMASFFLAYTTSGFPVDVNPPKDGRSSQPLDIEQYKQKLSNPPNDLSYGDASILRYVDFAPATPPYMHRTQSIDYGIVIEGEIELILDSGEKRRLRRGDSCVQRATMHAWRNTSDTEWARMVFVLISSTLPVIGGNQLGTEMPSL
ncbi:Ascochitine biosynthesis cluster protein 2 [Erysiphe necator]|uniref:Putative cupin domain-containing protein n=1 Tax=Uncinula necator TaxID=52586 RepID=A0A0B1P8Y3_UNCNE|nr:Ascochitine biosynthesis cluster protein 2 [Erysiphe necator]KHJ35162.1 putative cupin domain-containing protein [Erysiphe necator]